MPSIRHLLEHPGDEQALCGYQKAPLDVIEHYIDPAGRACPQCGRIAGRREANELTTRG
jgi:hypothetical protein